MTALDDPAIGSILAISQVEMAAAAIRLMIFLRVGAVAGNTDLRQYGSR